MIKNEIQFAGNAGKDAEVKQLNNGGTMVSFSIGCTTKGKEGTPDKTTWFNCIAFGDSAKVAMGIRKGNNVYVVGPVRDGEEYVAKDGIKKKGEKTILCNFVGTIPRKDRDIGFEETPQKQTYKANTALYKQEEIDDIPF